MFFYTVEKPPRLSEFDLEVPEFATPEILSKLGAAVVVVLPFLP